MLAAPQDLLPFKTDFPCHERASSPGEMLLWEGPGWIQWIPSLCLRDRDGDGMGQGESGQEGSSSPVPLSPQLAVSVGNTRFNEIMEATLPAQDCSKPSASSDM